MSNMHALITRNKKFTEDFTKAELPILPNLRMVRDLVSSYVFLIWKAMKLERLH